MKHWTTMRTSQAVTLCRDVPSNWRVFATAMQKEFKRTANPRMQARAAALALQLGEPVPSWAADWLAGGLVQNIENGKPLNKALGLSREGRGRGSAEKDEARNAAKDYQIFVMKFFTENERLKVDVAAGRTAKLLRKNYPTYHKAVSTIESEWYRAHRKIAKQIAPITLTRL